MTEAELREHMLRDPAPGESEAGERAWVIVREAHVGRDRVPWVERHSRLIVVVALLAALAVAAVSPPGRAVVDTVREKVAETPATEAPLDRLPAPGRLLVATEGNRLVTLDPNNGEVRWSLSRDEPIADARWSGGGLDTRIAYRAGTALHVVAGDGAPDAVLAENVPAVAPA